MTKEQPVEWRTEIAEFYGAQPYVQPAEVLSMDYAIALQRAIEFHCDGEKVPPAVARHCPHHAEMLNAALTQPVQPTLSPHTAKRAEALTLYKSPFKYLRGYIYDANNLMVADQDCQVKEGIAVRVRGWGRISYKPDAAALQDEVGHVVAQALTEFWERSKETT